MKKIKKLFPILLVSTMLSACNGVETFTPSFEKYENKVSLEFFTEKLSDEYNKGDMFANHKDEDKLTTDAVAEARTYQCVTIEGKANDNAKAKKSKAERYGEVIVKFDTDTNVYSYEGKTANKNSNNGISAGVMFDSTDYYQPYEMHYEFELIDAETETAYTSNEMIQPYGTHSYILNLDNNTGEISNVGSAGYLGTRAFEFFVGQNVNYTAKDTIADLTTYEFYNTEAEYYLDNYARYTIVCDISTRYNAFDEDDTYAEEYLGSYVVTSEIKAQIDFNELKGGLLEKTTVTFDSVEGAEITYKIDNRAEFSLNFDKNVNLKAKDISDFKIEGFEERIYNID